MPRILAAAACIALFMPASATPATAPLEGYRIVSWGGGDGVALGSIRAIAQDEDGYLWLAAEPGLVRFDGLRFATFGLVADAELPAAPARAVFRARDGSLWVGYGAGHGVYHLDRGRVRGVYLHNAFTGFVNAIVEDRAGAVWIGHDDGLHRVIGDQIERVVALPAGPSLRVLDVRQDRAGTLWLGTSSGLYRRRTGSEHFERVSSADDVVRGLSEDATGEVWVTDDTYGFRRADARGQGQLTGRGMSLFHDRSGHLWIATIGQGLWKMRRSEHRTDGALIEVATVERGLLSNEMSGFLEDRDGNIWVGSNFGLHRLRPTRVTSVVGLGVMRGVTFDAAGTAWVGGTGGVMALSAAGDGVVRTRRVISPAPVRTLHRSRDGTLWVATTEGVFHLVGDSLQGPMRGHTPLTRVTSLASDGRGVVWACDELAGVIRIDDARMATTSVTFDSAARPLFVRSDGANRLWVAFDDGTLRARAVDGTTITFGPSEGLSHRRLFAVHETRDGTLWVGGDAGLSRLSEGRFHAIRPRQGLPDRPVMAITSDDAGHLWVALQFFGVIRLAPEQTSRALADQTYRLRYPVYNAAAGTAGLPDTPNPEGAIIGPDGRLWFVTSRGLTILDPRALRHDQDVPLGRPRVEGVVVDDRWEQARSGLVVPPRAHRVLIDYALVNLSSFDQVRFRYRLEGFDPDWVDGTGRRQASYTNLPPGRYTFRVQAADLAHDWGDATAEWSFALRPAYYQTSWFFGGCAIGVVLLAAGAWQLRSRQVRRQLAVVLSERIRLSREIHDTLLQGMVGVALRLDVLSGDLEPGATGTRAALVRTRKQLEEYIREARQAIWTMRAPALQRDDLVTALQALGEHASAGHVRFVLRVTGRPRPCDAKVETQVLRIAREAVTNVVRHANAQLVDVHVDFADQWLRLRVTDDGHGFDPAALKRVGAHFGVAVMQERAAEVGGRCVVESVPGAGAQVVADIPLAS